MHIFDAAFVLLYFKGDGNHGNQKHWNDYFHEQRQ